MRSKRLNFTSLRRLLPPALVVAAVAAFAPAALAAPPPAHTFANSDGIAINDGVCVLGGEHGHVRATPYPSTIGVSGLAGEVVKDVNVTLTGFTHPFPTGVRVLLVGPQGQTTLLMDHSANHQAHLGPTDYDNRTVTFDDAAAVSVDGSMAGGTYKPATQRSPHGCSWISATDSLPAPAPAGPYGSTLGGFNGTDPNGDWKLYVAAGSGVDDAGTIAGWSLDITAGPPDSTAPSTMIALDPAEPDGGAGWYVSSPRVTVSAADQAGGSGVGETRCVLDPASVPASFADMPAGCDYAGAGAAVAGDGEHVLYAASRDQAGNTEAPVKRVFKVDSTAPSVGYSGNQGSYEVDAMVEIACQAGDAGSGIDGAATSCASIQAPAYQFAVGANTLQAVAVDLAGNTASASASFDVRLSADGLCRLTTRFVQGSARYAALTVTQRAAVDRLADGLCRGLATLAPSLTPIQKTAVIRAYQAGVTALATSGWVTSDQAAALRGLAGQL